MTPPLQLGLGMNLARGSAAPGPVVDWDFTTMTELPDGVYSGASAKTYSDQSGVLQTAGSGVSRLAAYDPTGTTRLGLFLEHAGAVNISTLTGDISNWFRNQAVLGSTTTAPDGSENAVALLDNSSTATPHYAYHAQALHANATTYAMSVFAKQASHEWVQLSGTSSAYGTNVFANFHLSGDGSIGATKGSANVDAYIEKYANGWYRCVLVGTTTAGASAGPITIVLINNNDANRAPTYSGGGNGVYLWGAQSEIGTKASSYTPNPGSTGTTGVRAAESLDVASLWKSGKAATVLMSWIPYVRGVAKEVIDASDNLRVLTGAADADDYHIDINGTASDAADPGTPASGAVHGMIARMAPDGGRLSVQFAGGEPAVTTVTETADLAIAEVLLLASQAGYLRSFKYWDKALSDTSMDTELAALSL
jgi:hypothetical protein